jgi:hypothetical protein
MLIVSVEPIDTKVRRASTPVLSGSGIGPSEALQRVEYRKSSTVTDGARIVAAIWDGVSAAKLCVPPMVEFGGHAGPKYLKSSSVVGNEVMFEKYLVHTSCSIPSPMPAPMPIP